jgi:DNA-binding transcriptional LysR family regulator
MPPAKHYPRRNPTSAQPEPVRAGWRAHVNDKLEFLIALAREQHFGRAAKACGVTQPTLSAGIKQLEDNFGVPLVNRGARYLGLTLEGERVLEWARRIVGDTRAMREEIRGLRLGLVGHLRIAAIPTALAMVPALTTPYREQHPGVRFTVRSATSSAILDQLENFDVDAGLTYLGSEPIGRVRAVPLYRERYRLVTSSVSPLGDRDRVSWAEVARVPLCLLTPDMQNRRIIDRLLSVSGPAPTPTLESNSMIALFAHVLTGKWASIMPGKMADLLEFPEKIRNIPIDEPDTTRTIGLVVSNREPMTALCAALVQFAVKLAPTTLD